VVAKSVAWRAGTGTEKGGQDVAQQVGHDAGHQGTVVGLIAGDKVRVLVDLGESECSPRLGSPLQRLRAYPHPDPSAAKTREVPSPTNDRGTRPSVSVALSRANPKTAGAPDHGPAARSTMTRGKFATTWGSTPLWPLTGSADAAWAAAPAVTGQRSSVRCPRSALGRGGCAASFRRKPSYDHSAGVCPDTRRRALRSSHSQVYARSVAGVSRGTGRAAVAIRK